MSSAILAKSGSATGEMLMAYPNTAFTNDNTRPEVFKLQLRVYLGACVVAKSHSLIGQRLTYPHSQLHSSATELSINRTTS